MFFLNLSVASAMVRKCLTGCKGTQGSARSRRTQDTPSCSGQSSCHFKALGTTQTQPIQRCHPPHPHQPSAFPHSPTRNRQVMPPGLDINRPGDWLLQSTAYSPSTGGMIVQPLHFVVAGSGGNITARPYFEIQEKGQIFTNYPCFP